MNYVREFKQENEFSFKHRNSIQHIRILKMYREAIMKHIKYMKRKGNRVVINDMITIDRTQFDLFLKQTKYGFMPLGFHIDISIDKIEEMYLF